MGQFDTVRLAASRVLVKGTDNHGSEGQVVLSTHQWDEVKSRSEQNDRLEAFDAAVEEFYAPLTAAADAFNEAEQKAHAPDPLGYVEVEPAVEGKPGHPGTRITLSHDSQVLRLIEEGNTDRLVWVGDNLEITEYVRPSDDAVSTVEANADLV